MPQHRALPYVVLTGAVAAALLLTGCGYQERVCLSDHYPVLAVNNSGGDCVRDGENPGEGWARYPEGMEPRYVGDKWDRYWSDKTLDGKGRVVPQPG
ncbi:SCO0607 family lipoprotein [Streptomyces sp. NPDC057116]|uniref:SCO0607 family lipoprotein n=1 Tax=Streptomyces sp. NPDC057116 TaxID=3346023 RepID=UPI003631A984